MHYARGWCQRHWNRWRLTASPGPAEIGRYGRGEESGSGAAHDRVKALRGAARNHTCQHCDAPAAEWAYDHADPNQKWEVRRGFYSTDPDHYIPLCKRCHSAFDGRVKDECLRGHRMEGDNIYIDPDGHRNCRACSRARNARYREKIGAK